MVGPRMEVKFMAPTFRKRIHGEVQVEVALHLRR